MMTDKLGQPMQIGDRVVHITRQGSWTGASIGIITEMRFVEEYRWRAYYEVKIKRTRSDYPDQIGQTSRWILAKNVVRV